MMKRIALLSLLIVGVFEVMAQRFDYTYKGVEFKCKVIGDGVCITAFSANAADVVIPATVVYKGNNFPVKQVSTFLNGVNYLTVNLTLEDGIEDIDKYSFNEFRRLLSVRMPASVKHIGKSAFRDNPGLAFTMCSGVDESSLRQGKEMWPTGGGEMITAHSAKSVPQMQDKQLAENKKAEKEKVEEKVKEKEEKVKKENGSKEGFAARLLAHVMKNEDKNKSDDNKNTGTTPSKTKELASVAEVAPQNPVLPPVDVDINIPTVVSDKNKDTYCVIIANENYKDVPEVDYALRDGEIFKEYCVKTFGIPEKQIRMFTDASYTDIKRALNWVETMANVTEGKSKIIFYYAGHGMPDEKDKTAYLIPTDGFPKDITTCFKLSELYGRLAKMQTQSITVLLDACFSGVKRGTGQALVAARGIAIKPKDEVLGGNMVVFTAASDDETALSYKEKRHGMFTYFLLDQLKKTKGEIKFGDLFTTLSSEVKKNSMLENDKLQTPSVNVSDNLKSKWKDLQF